MRLHFIGKLPVIGYREVDGRDLAFAWHWRAPNLRVTFTEGSPALLGQVSGLDALPRLVTAPENLAWVRQDEEARTRAVLDHAIDLWKVKEELFRHCEG